jgi:hypothetical protein
MTLSEYILVLISIVVGLGMTHLLSGAAEIVQHAKTVRPYWIHTAWMVNLFITIVHFWWWEFRLVRITTWTFVPYAFVVCYAVLYYLLVALLVPQRGETDDIREHYYSHRKWFFGTMALMQVVDFGDTLVKGMTYFRALGLEYPIRNIAIIVLSLIAIRTRSPKFHGALVVLVIAYQVIWIMRRFNTMG